MAMKFNKLGNCKFKLKGKKAFAFSFLVFFLVILVFVFLNLQMLGGTFTKENVFVDLRVNSLNNELYYFKTTYLENIVSYSFYNTIDRIQNYSKDSSHFEYLNQNYSMLNDAVYQVMMTGNISLTGISEKILEDDKTLNYLINDYRTNFEENYKANLSFEILDINVYEENPYYLSLQLFLNWSVTTTDNISSWQAQEDIFIGVPIFDLAVPDVLYNENKFLPARAVEYYLPSQNWSISNFNDSLNESYLSVYVYRDHRYTLGNSYLKRMLNISYGSYDKVIGFWSFDYDRDEKEVFDSTLLNNFSLLKGNSVGVYDFENSNVTHILDLSDNFNDALIGGADCSVSGIYGLGCIFEDSSDNIRVDNFQEIEKEISVFSWVRLNSSNGNRQNLVCSQDKYFCYYINDDLTVSVKLDNTQKTGLDEEIVFDVNVSIGVWEHIGFTYDGFQTYLYLNGIKYISQGSNMDSFSYYGNLNGSSQSVYIGNDNNLNFNLNGNIDEVGIYSKVLTRKEISDLYENRQVQIVDYLESFYGEGLFFDGIDDYINLGDTQIYDFENDEVGIEIWFKTDNVSKEQVLIDKGVRGNQGWGVKILDQKIYFGFHGQGTSNTILNVINQTDYWYHIVVIGGDRSQEDRFYVNGRKYLAANDGNWVLTNGATNYNLTIGKSSDLNDNYFDGIIDEIKIYNRSLTQTEIVNNYLNYDSFGKGCCNFLLMINPNKFGYNDSLYKKNVSYSSKSFYDSTIRNLTPDVLLFNISGFTSSVPSEHYYNLLIDICLYEAFHVSDYQAENENYSSSIHHMSSFGSTCSDLILNGIY